MREKSTETAGGFLEQRKLRNVDPATAEILDLEDERQARKIIFIASESICPLPVREAVASSFSNIYAEGYPALRMSRDDKDLLLDFGHMLTHHRRYADRRYYKGCEFANFVEALAQRRAAELFATEGREDEGPRVSPSEIFVNVQPLSGAAANNAVYDAFLKPGDTILGLDLSHGGHLTHGSPANRSGRTYRAVAYGLDENGFLDYDAVRLRAEECRPRLIVAGFSAYPLTIDWGKLREIADSVDALLLADISHPAGLVVAGCFPSPVGYADVISSTTHKTLCGPRGALLMTTDEEHAKRLDRAVFPGEQGGPHLNAIAGKAVAFLLARSDAYRALMRGVRENARALALSFHEEGLRVAAIDRTRPVSPDNCGTESHLCLVDLKPLTGAGATTLSGEIASRILDLAGITCNKNTIPGDRNAAHPSGLRFGTTWVTQRGLVPADMKAIAGIVARLLRGIRPFTYLDGRSRLGRGKIEHEVLETSTREVAAITTKAASERSFESPRAYPHDFPAAPSEASTADPTVPEGRRMVRVYTSEEEELAAARESAAVFDLADHTLLEVSGWRASLFLHEMTTGDILSLAIGQHVETAIADRTGQVRDIVRVARLSRDEQGRDRYLVLASPGGGTFVREWMRAVSDGYVVFDDTDLLRKVQGPVVVHDLSAEGAGADPPSLLSVVGKKAGDTIRRLGVAAAEVKPGRLAFTEGTSVTVLRDATRPEFVVIVARDSAELVKKSLEQGAVPAGIAARDSLRPTALPRPIAELRQARPELFQLAKPYFVGQTRLLPATPKTSGKGAFAYTEKDSELKKSCLFEEHQKLTKATHLVPFAGWKMPLQYSSIADEHEAVRSRAGLFDVSHMGVLGFRGEHAARFLDLITANYVHWLEDGQAQYSFLFDASGHVLDDILVYRLRHDDYMMVVNAANEDKVKSWLSALVKGEAAIDLDHDDIALDVRCDIRDLKTEGPEEERRVDLALQGPMSLDILREAGGHDLAVRIQELRRFDFLEGELGGCRVLISRTGYTGEEIGYELYLRPDQAPAVWRLLLAKGAELGIAPTGLGARDSTRAEAGLPLYGHELGGALDLIPSEAGYGSFVKLHKPFFIGRSGYLRRMEASTRTIIRFRLTSGAARRIKPGDPVVDTRGEKIGVVCSSVLVRGTQQGLACVERKAAQKDAIVHIFPVPEGARARNVLSPSELSTAEAGSRSVLPVEATILTRFMRAPGRLPRITARRSRQILEAVRGKE